MYKQIFSLALLVACASAGPIDFENCGNDNSAIVTELRVTDCDSLPCVFYKGQTYTVEVDAEARTSSNTLPYKVTAVVVVPITILEGDACQNLTAGSCPAAPGDRFTYAADFNIGTTFPTVNTAVTATVRDDNNNVVICATLRIQIRPSPMDELLAIAKYFSDRKQPLEIATN